MRRFSLDIFLLAISIVLIGLFLIDGDTPQSCAVSSAHAQVDCASEKRELAHLQGQIAETGSIFQAVFKLQADGYVIDRNLPDCGNGLRPQFEVGLYGVPRVNEKTPSTLRPAPGARGFSTIPVGRLFLVVDGPECSNGITFWKVYSFFTGEVGWISEGNESVYWNIPTNNVGFPLDDKYLNDELAGIPHGDFGHYNALEEYSIGLGQACPYVFTRDDQTNSWAFDTTILTYFDSPAKETMETKSLTRFDGSILIREIEPEISFIDAIWIDVTDSAGNTQRLLPDLPSLQAADDQYHVMEMGDEIVVMFPGFSELTDVVAVQIVYEGYYEWLR